MCTEGMGGEGMRYEVMMIEEGMQIGSHQERRKREVEETVERIMVEERKMGPLQRDVIGRGDVVVIERRNLEMMIPMVTMMMVMMMMMIGDCKLNDDC